MGRGSSRGRRPRPARPVFLILFFFVSMFSLRVLAFRSAASSESRARESPASRESRASRPRDSAGARESAGSRDSAGTPPGVGSRPGVRPRAAAGVEGLATPGLRARQGVEGKTRRKKGKKEREKKEAKVDAAPGLPGRSPIPVLFRPKGA